MSDQIREQVSAFLDGELPGSETELLLKRLIRDNELREGFGRYALIGEAMRGTHRPSLTRSFAARVNSAIDGEDLPISAPLVETRVPRWWRPFGGAAVVAGVAAVAIVALQHRAVGPTPGAMTATNRAPTVTLIPASGRPQGSLVPQRAALPMTASNPTPVSASAQDISYTTPPLTAEPPVTALPPGRMASYVFAHSKYSSGLGQRGVLADLLIEDDAPAAKPEPAVVTTPTP